MTDSIQKLTLENAAEQLKLKIRSAFVELLPEEQWKQMVEAELKRFTQPTREQRYNGGPFEEKPSGFEALCREAFTEYLKTEIKTLLQSPEWREKWGSSTRPQISDAIQTWLTAHSAELIQSTVQTLAGQVAQQLITSMAHR